MKTSCSLCDSPRRALETPRGARYLICPVCDTAPDVTIPQEGGFDGPAREEA
jgi:LSD1 subclass zinc finger protein